ncbi:hypothetical protein E4U53_008002 [Claviceps sorghi]|nr:hypothetical protein E4U53_008002 [Claviceps sorghi]
MKTPGPGGAAHKIPLGDPDEEGVDLAPGATLQRLVSFALKEEGNHVLAVTVSYYEATETSGRTRTFRKLYQFICKAGLVVRTKVGVLGAADPARKWVLEAQLENSSDNAMQLDSVEMEVPDGLSCQDCNWETQAQAGTGTGTGAQRPILHPGEVEQVCFVLSRDEDSAAGEDDAVAAEGRIALGSLGIAWRGSMGNKGFISTGQLGTRLV